MDSSPHDRQRVLAEDIAVRRDSTRLLEGIVAGISDSLIAVDHSWRVCYLTPRVAERIGRPGGELLGADLWEAVPSIAATDFGRQLHAVMIEQRPRRFEALAPLLGGSSEVHAFPTPDGGLAAYAVDAAVCKIAERRRLTEQSVGAPDRILGNLPDAIVVSDPGGAIRVWVGGAEQVFGYSADEAMGRPLTFLYPPDLQAQGPSFTPDHSLNDQFINDLFSGESNCVHKSGHVILVETRAKLMRDPAGQPQAIVAIHRDITERTRVDQELRRAAARLAEAQELAHLGSWEWSVETNVVSWSEETYRIYGLTSTGFEGTYEAFLARVHPDDVAQTRQCIENAYSQRCPFAMDHRIVRPTGEVRTVHARGRVVLDDAGKPVRMVGTGQDITERKQAEEEIRKLHVELERRVEERTAALRRSNEDLQQFAFVSSHDLQEPLRTLISYAQLLQKKYQDQLDAQANEFVGFIVDAARRMNALISDLLTYSYVADVGSTRNRAVNLDGIMATVEMNLAKAIQETGASIRHGDLPVVLGNEYQLIQLFQNLIGNAIKYRSTAPPAIEILTTGNEGEWLIGVRDNGIGIEPEYRERIFGLFKRLHGRDVPGTGLGLAICKRAVEKHGGRIWVDSEPGHGSTFWFTIPEG